MTDDGYPCTICGQKRCSIPHVVCHECGDEIRKGGSEVFPPVHLSPALLPEDSILRMTPVFFLLFYASILGVVAYRGLGVLALWSWFFVPFGLPELGYWHAVGVGISSMLFVKGWNVSHKKKPMVENIKHESLTSMISEEMWGLTMFIGLGWFAHLLMGW